MNAEYDKGYQSGYDAGYKRAMLDYGLEDDKPKGDTVLDEIRAEIAEEYKVESEHPYGQGLRKALQIIDKYKESEEV